MPSSKAKRSGKESAKKGKKKKRAPDTQNAGQSSAGSGGEEISKGSAESKRNTSCCCCRQSPCDRFLSMFGFGRRKRTDDMVVFDENASMESSLLWSKDGTEPTSEDYLEFVPEHEQKLADFATKVALPKPPEDRTDY
mmetsp:Transcript_41079/g.87513  ORF Transcript_41079/g.87513 Transcript_41079/m.87513 type:complete len:138 (+) Transcript_41079:113-526(+)|eukprot:CAMPEP_0172537864 /NCGR_PEP_ID=MMETSP1067-20121228/9394_1 /TAXON_ID=265564 ORGANISM="Thalassiosira punctigera, Strain Tpunct2005C2" /NCGR_SAMPLE_ID=MMETSP1067 /ASSEMBLY_ACC=CAM_ASM_000444 /LENGTH=137 /DNA_ID=CAMNT_0013323259 /DNA_START=93 /DNA_END=506 /DNA_ORIENTATION=-